MPTPPTSPLLGPPRDRVDLAHGGSSLLIAQLKNHMLRRTERT
ncbi:hypothetical protein [Streptomyces hokutonensis]|nr:hypothetical protein [Streptomyces hokutonensis]